MATKDPLKEWEKQFNEQITKLSTSNNVDLGVASAMLQANLLSGGQYKGGGTINSVDAANRLKAAIEASKNQSQAAKATSSQMDIYSLAERQKQAALKAQRDKLMAAYDAERAKVDPAYRSAMSSVAGTSGLSRRAMDEYLAQRGQTQSGIAAQTEMKRQAELTTAQGGLEQQRLEAITDLEKRKTGTEADYQSGILDASFERQMQELQAQQAEAERQRAESISTVGQYFQDYMAKIKDIEAKEAAGDFSESYLKPYLLMARNEKIFDQEQAAAKAKTASAGGAGSTKKPGFSQLAEAIRSAADPVQAFNELAAQYPISSTDYSDLQYLANTIADEKGSGGSSGKGRDQAAVMAVNAYKSSRRTPADLAVLRQKLIPYGFTYDETKDQLIEI